MAWAKIYSIQSVKPSWRIFSKFILKHAAVNDSTLFFSWITVNIWFEPVLENVYTIWYQPEPNNHILFRSNNGCGTSMLFIIYLVYRNFYNLNWWIINTYTFLPPIPNGCIDEIIYSILVWHPRVVLVYLGCGNTIKGPKSKKYISA